MVGTKFLIFYKTALFVSLSHTIAVTSVLLEIDEQKPLNEKALQRILPKLVTTIYNDRIYDNLLNRGMPSNLLKQQLVINSY